MAKINKQDLEFYPIVQELEEVLNSATKTLDLIRLIDEQEFLQLRTKIISVFSIGEMYPVSGEFGEEVEFGDVSDAVRATTFSLYPQDTEMDKPIGIGERKEWCKKMLETMDAAANFY